MSSSPSVSALRQVFLPQTFAQKKIQSQNEREKRRSKKLEYKRGGENSHFMDITNETLCLTVWPSYLECSPGLSCVWLC